MRDLISSIERATEMVRIETFVATLRGAGATGIAVVPVAGVIWHQFGAWWSVSTAAICALGAGPLRGYAGPFATEAAARESLR